MEQPGHDERPSSGRDGILLKRLSGGINRAIIVAVAAQGMQFGAALTLVPFMVTRLSPAEVGIWYVFVGIQALAIICDFGFLPSFTRAFALAHAGAEALATQGLEGGSLIGRPTNQRLLAEVMRAAKLFYRFLGIAIIVAGLGFGLPYVTHLAAAGGLSVERAQLAWGIFTIGIGLNLALQWVGPALLGTGRIEQNYLVIITNRGGFSLLGIAALLAGGGLVALSGAMIVSQVIARLLAGWFLRGVGGGHADRAAVHAILRTLWPNAARMGAVLISGFFITRYGLFAVSTFAGLAAGGSYALSLQMLNAVAAVSQLPMQVTMPRLVAARVAHERARLRRMYVTAMVGYFALYLTGAALVILVVPMMLGTIGSKVTLLPVAMLGLMAVILMLEGFHSNAAFFITTGNDVPFVRAAVISGVLIAAGTTLAGWLGLGIAAMIAWQGIVQLAYNNWRWPVMAWKEIAES